ncbi:hypothetical protein [Ruegeria sp.]|uniref:hypothetical protein n=1 Tax=Ruegeria sp. TaxID=1879320 RepID=UPI003B000504
MAFTKEHHINLLKLAEQQFRLACIVRVHAALETLPLDAPVSQSFGKHTSTWEEFGLRQDQIEYAAPTLEFVSTFVMSSAMRQAFAEHVPNARNHKNSNVAAAYQIARLTRNAFSHHMLVPRCSIDDDCKNRKFEVGEVIRLDTSNLDGQPLRWDHYGGHLAIWRLCQWVRFNVLDDKSPVDRVLPERPAIKVIKQGNLFVRKIGDLSSDDG